MAAFIHIYVDVTLLLHFRVSISIVFVTTIAIATFMEVIMGTIVDIGFVCFTALGIRQD